MLKEQVLSTKLINDQNDLKIRQFVSKLIESVQYNYKTCQIIPGIVNDSFVILNLFPTSFKFIF